MAHKTSGGGDEATEHEGEVVPRGHAVPESAGHRRDHAAGESGLLSLGSDAFVHTFAEPDVGLHVPGVKDAFEIGRQLDIKRNDIRRAVPLRLALRVETSESETGKDASALCQRPNSVVLVPLRRAKELEPNDPLPKRHFFEPRLESNTVTVLGGDEDVGAEECQANEHFAVRNALPATGQLARDVALDRDVVEELFSDELHVVMEVDIWADEDTREVEPW